MSRTFDTEHTNMILIEDKETGRMVVIDRKLSWCGISFPGGHVESGESMYESAVREAKEETGLTVKDLKFCGIIHWHNIDSNKKYMVYLYKTDKYEGELKTDSEEGTLYWITLDELKAVKDRDRISEYLPVFFDDSLSEAYGLYTDFDDSGFDIKYY